MRLYENPVFLQSFFRMCLGVRTFASISSILLISSNLNVHTLRKTWKCYGHGAVKLRKLKNKKQNVCMIPLTTIHTTRE